MKIVIFFILNLTILLFLNLNADVLTILQGKVIEENKEPIPNARIAIEGTKVFTETNSRGNYVIYDMPSGRYDISCSKDGYGKGTILYDEVKINYSNTRDFYVYEGEKNLYCNKLTIMSDTYIEQYKLISSGDFRASQVYFESSFPVLTSASSHYYLQRCLEFNVYPKPYIIRTEEMVNFYGLQKLQAVPDDSISLSIEYGNCPWNSEHNLVYVSLGVSIPKEETHISKNFVFLIDSSSSMRKKESIPLIKDAFRPFLMNLDEEDSISIIFYNDNRITTSPTMKAGNLHEILEVFNAIDNIELSFEGNPLEIAYETSKNNHIEKDNNTVVLITNDMYDLGLSSDFNLIKTLEFNRLENTDFKIALTSYSRASNELLQNLVSNELGEYYCLGDLNAAKLFFVKNLAERKHVFIKNPVLSVEFNPLFVSEYRIIGYEEYLVDKGKIRDEVPKNYGLISGESFVLAYELIPAQKDSLILSHDSKYTVNSFKRDYLVSDELMTVDLKFQDSANKSASLSKQFSNKINDLSNCSDNFKFSSAVIELSQVISDSPYKGTSSITSALELAESTSEQYNSFNKNDLVNICHEVNRLFDLKQQKTRK